MEKPNEQPVSTNPGRTGLSILIVEDEAAARIATRCYLQFCGYRVAAAGSATEAISMARDLHPDILVCDWKLDGGPDGIDVARLLQQEQDVDVIFVTAYALNELRQSAPDLRTVDCLRKPISLGTLAASIDSVATQKTH